MTLCVTYITDSGKAVSLTDSLLTTTRKKPDLGSFLPSDIEVIHQTPYAVKFHKISGVKAYSGNSLDILTAIAGNVSLHIDTYLQFGYSLWLADIKNVIQDKIEDFWFDSRDKQIQMSFALFDHKLRPQLFECRADERGQMTFKVVEPEEGFALSVLGDGCHEAKEQILSKINSLLYEYDLETAIHMGCVSVLQASIDDQAEVFIGGYIQGGQLNGYEGDYLVVDYGYKYLRGTMLDDYDNIELPVMKMNEPLFPIIRYAGTRR
jgi:hypothetical protein